AIRGAPAPRSNRRWWGAPEGGASRSDKVIEIRKKLRPTFSLDLIARTSKQIQQRLEMGDFFIQDILQRGRILYETNHTRVG
ncbi:MAG: hypothetical protein NTU99_09800, partial [Pseudanabaena sp. LacPavin_0818_WC45_MAG_42_6]|nr:hypothetical protein [Pseudanabaena sp. LacPavin_0818_WC45_MAG_42_6]